MLQRYCSWESGETEEASESQVCPSLSCSDWLIKCGDWGVAADLQARLLQADAAHYDSMTVIDILQKSHSNSLSAFSVSSTAHRTALYQWMLTE